jgi:hypothetical protein
LRTLFFGAGSTSVFFTQPIPSAADQLESLIQRDPASVMNPSTVLLAVAGVCTLPRLDRWPAILPFPTSE